MADLWRRTAGSKKGTVQVTQREVAPNFGDLQKSKKKLDGVPEGILEKFDELFKKSSDLFFACSQYSKKDDSSPFTELKSGAHKLVKSKNGVEASINALFEEYKKQEFVRHDPKAVLIKKESRRIIEKTQRSIETCRPLVDEVRQKKTATEANGVDIESADLGSKLDNPFDQE